MEGLISLLFLLLLLFNLSVAVGGERRRERERGERDNRTISLTEREGERAVSLSCYPSSTCSSCPYCCSDEPRYSDPKFCELCDASSCPLQPVCSPTKECNVCDECCTSTFSQPFDCRRCFYRECNTRTVPHCNPLFGDCDVCSSCCSTSMLTADACQDCAESKCTHSSPAPPPILLPEDLKCDPDVEVCNVCSDCCLPFASDDICRACVVGCPECTSQEACVYCEACCTDSPYFDLEHCRVCLMTYCPKGVSTKQPSPSPSFTFSDLFSSDYLWDILTGVELALSFIFFVSIFILCNTFLTKSRRHRHRSTEIEMESDTGNTSDAATTTEVEDDEDEDGLLYKSGSDERDGDGREVSSEYDDVDYI